MAAAEQKYTLRIAAGSVGGVYYPVANGICKLINLRRSEHGVRCSVAATVGSIENIDRLRSSPETTMAIVQSDTLVSLVEGRGAFSADTSRTSARTIITLQQEVLHLTTLSDASSIGVAELEKLRVNMGGAGTGTRQIAEAIFKVAGIRARDLSLGWTLKPAQQTDAICNQQFDVSMWMAGAPNFYSVEAFSKCGAKLVGLSDELIDKVSNGDRSLEPAIIPGGTYAGNPKDIKTIGSSAILIADSAMPDEVVRSVASLVHSELAEFVSIDPTLSQLTKRDLFRQGPKTPFHDAVQSLLNQNAID